MDAQLQVLQQMSMREAAALLVMEVEHPNLDHKSMASVDLRQSSGLGKQARAVRSRCCET